MAKETKTNDETQPTYALYKKPWFIIICLVAVLSMVGYIAVLA